MSKAQRVRLGRGLGALFGEDTLRAERDDPGLRTIPRARIAPNPFQPRREFDEGELEELVDSIRANGLLQPLVVRRDPEDEERFQLVAGERRLRALTELDWPRVPVLVRDVDDRALLVLALVENIQRAELGPLDEAEGYRTLVDDFGLTQGEVAAAVGKSRSTVANMLRLLRLPPSVRRLLSDGALSIGHARALLALDHPGRITELARRAAQEGWTVRQVEA
ncbi:MAG: ParB/RepB/Spo0J family partition protein, partial [Gemmatimonadota bacterium]